MNRAEIQKAAEDELTRRYNAQQVQLPPRPSSSSAVWSRPGTAPAVGVHPQTRPSSRIDVRHSDNVHDPDNVRETLMQMKRASSATGGRPIGSATTSFNASVSSTPLTRPGSAALALLELHKGADALRASSFHAGTNANGAGFFERSKFRDLYRQLEKANKRSFIASTWDSAALAAMEATLFDRPAAVPADPAAAGSAATNDASMTLLGQLEKLHSEIDSHVTSEVGGDGMDVSTDPEARLLYFLRQLKGHLKPHPAMQHLVNMILSEHERYITHLKRNTQTAEGSLLRETLYTTVQELSEAKRQFLEAEKKNKELAVVAERLTSVNDQLQKNQNDLEHYVDELRVTLSTFTNNNLRGAPAMRPDTSTKAGFVEAIRRLAREVETLREENVKLSEVAASYVDQQEAQTAEIDVLLRKANQYQQQVGNLKSAVRTMKSYVDQLEARLRELRNVHEENELLRSLVPMQVAKFEREMVLPLELNTSLAQHQFLQQKSCTLVCPAEYADSGTVPSDEKLVQLVTNRIPQRVSVQQHNTEDLYDAEDDEGYVDSNDLGSGGESAREGGGEGESHHGTHEGSGTNPSSGRSLAPSSVAPSEFMGPTTVPLPIHLSTRFGNAKLKPMTPHDVKALIVDLFTDYGNSTEKKRNKDPRFVPVLFEQYAKEWAHRRLKGERVSFEQNMSLFYWADVYRYKAPEMVMFSKASVGHVSGFVYDVVQQSLAALRRELQQVEPINKKQKDRIQRDALVSVLKAHFPLLMPVQLEAICASSIHAQEGRVTEDVAYEPYFDRANSGGAFMYDALARATIAHAESMFLKVEEAVYAGLHERNAAIFEKLQRARDECGTSGTVAAQQMSVESAVAEKCGKCPLRIVHTAMLSVDPHCPRTQLWLALAIASGSAEINRVPTEAEEEALEKVFDVSMLMKNLRRGVTFTISQAPAAPAEQDRSARSTNSNGADGGLARGTISPTNQDLRAPERSARPPSAKFVAD